MNLPNYPLISVVMTVRNGGDLLARAVDSILNQTCGNFEFIIINDGSTDDTLAVLKGYTDPRIQIYSQENQGVAKSANRGLSLAKGQYIARQDHDDFSLSTRLEKQLAFLERHDDYGLIGTGAEIWSSGRPTGRYHDHPTHAGVLAFELNFNNPFVHTSCMFRKAVVDGVGYYSTDPLITPIDDYEFVSRVSRRFKVGNLAERLVIYTETVGSLSRPLGSKIDTHFVGQRVVNISSQNIAFTCAQRDDSVHVRNLAALINNQLHLIQGKPSYRAMRELVRAAGSKHRQQVNDLELDEAIARQLDNLYHHYFHAPKVASRIESVANRVWQRLKHF
jgi:glycosyltransferase involved in cell wall biosynthesis